MSAGDLGSHLLGELFDPVLIDKEKAQLRDFVDRREQGSFPRFGVEQNFIHLSRAIAERIGCQHVQLCDKPRTRPSR